VLYALGKILNTKIGRAIVGVVKQSEKLVLVKFACLHHFGDVDFLHPRDKVLLDVWSDVEGDII
jgi:hypothetical protein